jgi:flagellar hook-associated protein 2
LPAALAGGFMAISSTGIGSGLDVNSIISQLTALEKQPLVALQTKAATIQSKISTVGQLSAQMSALNDAAFNLSLDSAWSAVATSSSNSGAVTASAASGTSPTSFSVEVSQLARAQSTASSAVAADAQIGTGSLTIDIGSWDFGTTQTPTVPPVFTAGATPSINITIGAGENTLTAIAKKINDANAGVTATILQDVTGQRLLVRSTATGAAAGFRIQATDDDGNNADNAGLSSLAFDPATTPSNPADSGFGMGLNSFQQANDSIATINGVKVQSATNSVKDAVPGLTLKLSAVTTAPVQVDITNDTTTVTKNIQSLVDAYNALNGSLADATKYDAATKTAGILQGDSVVVSLQNALRNMITSASSGSSFSRLADIGISMQLGGNLSVDSTKLSAATSGSLSDVKKLLALNNSDPKTNGLARKAKDFATSALSVNGLITNESNALQGLATSNQKDQDRVTAHANAVAAQLKATYSALDVQMGSLTALNQFVTQQVALWNKG